MMHVASSWNCYCKISKTPIYIAKDSRNFTWRLSKSHRRIARQNLLKSRHETWRQQTWFQKKIDQLHHNDSAKGRPHLREYIMVGLIIKQTLLFPAIVAVMSLAT